MNERTPRRTLGNPSVSLSDDVPTATPAPADPPAYVSPFGHVHARDCAPGDDTWLGHAERAATALRDMVAGLRSLTGSSAMDPDGGPAVALRGEAVRLARIVTTCLDADADPARRNTTPYEGMHL